MLLIKECILASKRKKAKSTRYSNEWILICLLIRIKHQATYTFLRENKILPLPAKSTIESYLKRVRSKCGFDKEFLENFEKQLSKLPEGARHGVLLFDEMIVRKSIAVNSRTATFDGLADDGTNSTSSLNEMADHALVIMFSSLQANFHQPIATFASKNSTPGETLAKLILQAITVIENAGGKIDAMICDGATTNRKMWDEFNVSGKIDAVNHFVANPCNENRNIYIFSDSPHLIKCVRNRVMSKNLKVNIYL